MNLNPNAVAICGLYCGACFNWVNCHDHDDRLIKPRDESQQPCEGCRSENLPPQCASCRIRRCARGRGHATCAECDKMPCEMIEALAQIPRPHIHGVAGELRRIREVGEKTWADEQRARWTCPQCGAHTSWYQDTCEACGSAVAGFDRGQWQD